MEATEVGTVCRTGSGGWETVLGRLPESREPSLLGLTWVSVPWVWLASGPLLYPLCTPHAAAASLAEKEILVFLPVLLGPFPCHSRADMLGGLLGGGLTAHGSRPTAGLKGPQNEGLRGRAGESKMDEEKGSSTIPSATLCSLDQDAFSSPGKARIVSGEREMPHTRPSLGSDHSFLQNFYFKLWHNLPQ